MNSDDARVIDLYQSGLSMAAVGKLVGLSPLQVQSILKKNGVKPRSRKEALQKYARYNVCVICGNRFRARLAWNSGQNLYRETCSDECLFELRSHNSKSKWTEERRIKQSAYASTRDMSHWNFCRGSDKPNWKGGKSSVSYTKIAFEQYGLDKICEICGSIENICVHHRDRNRSNNSRSNLMIVCKPCHTQLHSKNGDCGWKLYNSLSNHGTMHRINISDESGKI